MPSLFSQAAAMTSTPSAIQFSTISFCFAGSLSVGPSNSRSTPSAFAAFSAPALQEMKYALPFDFGRSAMVIFLPPPAAAPPAEDSGDLPQPANSIAAARTMQRSFFMGRGRVAEHGPGDAPATSP